MNGISISLLSSIELSDSAMFFLPAKPEEEKLREKWGVGFWTLVLSRETSQATRKQIIIKENRNVLFNHLIKRTHLMMILCVCVCVCVCVLPGCRRFFQRVVGGQRSSWGLAGWAGGKNRWRRRRNECHLMKNPETAKGERSNSNLHLIHTCTHFFLGEMLSLVVATA